MCQALGIADTKLQMTPTFGQFTAESGKVQL